MKARFKLKDGGPISKFVGVNYSRTDNNGVTLSHELMIQEVIGRYGMKEAHGASIPLAPGTKLVKRVDGAPDIGDLPFCQALGSIMYIMLMTRPDISFAVSALSQFTSAPTLEHWKALLQVLWSLKSMASARLVYPFGFGNPLVLEGFVNADYNNSEDRHSFSGYVFTIDGVAIFWATKKQQTTSLSTMESEYMAASQAAREAMWLCQAMAELGQGIKTPTIIFTDNQSSLSLTKNPEYHSRSKHIDTIHHYVREHVEDGNVEFRYISTKAMVADVLTKALPHNAHRRHIEAMGLRLGGGNSI